MIYLFTYDLHPNFPRDIEPLKKELRTSRAWSNYLERTWLIGTDETVVQLHGRIAPHMTANDSWLVVHISDYWGWLPKEAWDWIDKTRNIMGM